MISLKSSSLHIYNADGRPKTNRAVWTFFNTLNNSFLPNRAKGVDVKSFTPRTPTPLLQKVSPSSSPSRAITDMFLQLLDWKKIQEFLGGIRICDIGCGTGSYFQTLQHFSGNRVQSYLGLDAKKRKHWQEITAANVQTAFAIADINHPIVIPDRTTLVITNSFLEHLEYDISFFEQIAGHCQRTDSPLIQIHTFPAASCINQYSLHGIRQYTPRGVARLARSALDLGQNSLLIALGGPRSSSVHMQYITRPLRTWKKDLRFEKPDDYLRDRNAAIQADIASRTSSAPTFYALLVTPQSFQGDIFKP